MPDKCKDCGKELEHNEGWSFTGKERGRYCEPCGDKRRVKKSKKRLVKKTMQDGIIPSRRNGT